MLPYTASLLTEKTEIRFLTLGYVAYKWSVGSLNPGASGSKALACAIGCAVAPCDQPPA